MKQRLIQYYVALKEAKRNIKRLKAPQHKAARLEAYVIRYLHIIEKGLSLEKPRMGFGIQKIETMFEYVREYLELETDDLFCIYMARDAVRAYLSFHEQNDYKSDSINSISEQLKDLEKRLPPTADDDVYGGVLEVTDQDRSYSLEDIEKLFRSRHSVRDFSGETISEEDIKKAIELAGLYPSACNRQCARVYSIDAGEYLSQIGSNLQGIGGFADVADKFLLVTAKTSAYSIYERNQYIVSSGIFAGYLTLALQAYNIAACTVQRSLLWDDAWDQFAKKHGIPEDEQIVVMLAIGGFKEKTTVPVSKRFPIEKIYRKL